ncbi:MAG: phosphate acyltransferase PlsX [Acidimicrobiales bacterium]|nr:phosphate acyltransferase PlsX [Acidimicrobiales bacterium]MYG88196.1 phosphate acyltransferase PlsX [Acidimicrobiales bacterium]MYI26848.1 phosphate acyltransferase PlsX [Acidimicrobiales bacterium]
MGGDDAPAVVVEGALEAVREGLDVVLVGRRDAIAAAGGESLPIIEASEVIEMSEEPSRAVRTKRDSSISRAVNAVRDGEASAVVSAGNTGAVAAAALLRLKRLPGVARPAIATAFPVPGGRTARVLLDSGAMADCDAQWLHQFARLGSAYSRIRFGVAVPSVGLLSIGEEPEKGNLLIKETHKLLAADDEIDFYGNVEGGDLLDGPVDVVVTDGFTGNVLLKSLEGTASFFVRLILERLAEGGEAGAAALRLLAPLADEMSADNIGGAVLLGVRGVCVIAHGSSSPKAITSAVRAAHRLVAADLLGELAAVSLPSPPRDHR